MKDNKGSNKKIRLTLPHRFFMTFFYISQHISYLYFSLLMFHYLFMPIPLLFSSPSLLASQHHETSYIFNAFMYSLFFVQHVGMALIIFKTSLETAWSKYPLYERYLYNISS